MSYHCDIIKSRTQCPKVQRNKNGKILKKNGNERLQKL